MMEDRHIVFPPFRLEMSNERLYRGDAVIPLRPKTLGVLRHLLDRPGRLVTKDELLDAVWQGVSVGDAVLKGCVRELREALDDDPEAPRFIETAHRRGYRFIGAVIPPSDPPQLSIAAASAVVGRETELTAMRARLEHALTGERQFLFVTGEAGVGKTTIVEAFADRIAPASGVRVARGQCIADYGMGEAYLPMLEALGRLCRQRGGERLLRLMKTHAPTWLAQMPALASGARLDDLDPEVDWNVLGTTPRRMLREMADALEAMAAVSPLVLILEDLHWSDYSTLDLLASLARRREPARLLIVATYRHGDAMAAAHPIVAVKQELQIHRLCTELALPGLGEAAVADYLGARFADHRFPDELVRVLHRLTDGHPLFLVSVVDDIVARGGIAAADRGWALTIDVQHVRHGIPEGIRQMIERQIDRLNADEQRIVEAASVAGIVFPSALVAAVLGDEVIRVEVLCEALTRRRQLLSSAAAGELPSGITTRYQFVHDLYRHVLYERIPAARRADLHRRIGQAAEAMYGEDPGELAAELALHFDEGRDYQKAVAYYERAAENASRRSANQEIVAMAERGLALLARLPETSARTGQMLTLRMMLGTALIALKGYSAPEVEAVYRLAHDQCCQLGDRPELFRVLWGLGRFYLVRTPLDTAREFGERMLSLAERANDRDLLLQAHNALAGPLFHMGEFERARDHFERGLALYDEARDRWHAYLYVQDPRVVCLARLALALWCLGFPDRAAATSEEAIVYARRLAHPFSEAFALSFAATLQQLRRDWRLVRELGDTAYELSTQHGFSIFAIMSLLFRGSAQSEDGDPEGGRATLTRTAQAAEAAGAGLFRAYTIGTLARVTATAGRLEEASTLVDEALGAARQTGEHFYDAELHRLEGEFLLLSESPDREVRAERCFQEAIGIATAQGALSWKLRAVISLARLYVRQLRAADSRQILVDTYAAFREGFETPDLCDARALLKSAFV